MDCPCKKIPLSLSSFTAAEYGDVHSLIDRQQKQDGNRSIVDAAGNTPLHLAAQHGQIAATAFLLKSGLYGVNQADGGASPLHRASFAGSVGTMRILMNESDCDLLMADTSFGDRMTPLHKATAGGRFMAVQLLIEELDSRKLLKEALTCRDGNNQIPLDIAKTFMVNQEEMAQSVARWNGIAGGHPNWELCFDILEKATERIEEKIERIKVTSSQATSKVQFDLDRCFQCQVGQPCVTASWEAAFSNALSNNIRTTIGSISRSDSIPSLNNNVTGTKPTEVLETRPNPGCHTAPFEAKVGEPCQRCGRTTVTLYRSMSEKLLVCKSCRKTS